MELGTRNRDVAAPVPIELLPSFHFDAGSYGRWRRLDAINEVYRGLFRCSISPDDWPKCTSAGYAPVHRFRAWRVGEMAASSFEYQRLNKWPIERMASNLSEMLVLTVVRKGRLNAESGDIARVLGPGGVNLMCPGTRIYRSPARPSTTTTATAGVRLARLS